MSIDNALREELLELAVAYTSGMTSREQFARLENLLDTSEEARAFYIDSLGTHANLYWYHRQYEGETEDRSDGVGRSKTTVSPFPISTSQAAAVPLISSLSSVVPSSSAFPHITPTFDNALNSFSSGWALAYLLATVITGLLLFAGSLIHVSGPEQVARQPDSLPSPAVRRAGGEGQFVGRITGMLDCRWAEKGTVPFCPPGVLSPFPPKGSGFRAQGSEANNHQSSINNRQSPVSLGDHFALSSGLLEITYNTGAKVILQGPVNYEVESNGGFLSLGKLTGKLEKGNDEARMTNDEGLQNSSFVIPPSSFVIRTPTATVTDLGTEFGVEVDRAGGTGAHVFHGAVELQTINPAGKEPRKVFLAENQAARVASDGNGGVTILALAARPASFARQIHPHKRVAIELFNTGTDIAEGQPDPHWQIVAASDNPHFQSRPAVVTRTFSTWLDNNAVQSSWISLAADPADLPFDVTYTFRTTFELKPGMQPSTAQLSGWFIADNHVRAIRLNGHVAPVPEHPYLNFSQYRRFSIRRGFVAGCNVLEFDVFNGVPGVHSGFNPMGLRVDLQGSVYEDSAAKPESTNAGSLPVVRR
jgi:hypothetical protein